LDILRCNKPVTTSEVVMWQNLGGNCPHHRHNLMLQEKTPLPRMTTQMQHLLRKRRKQQNRYS